MKAFGKFVLVMIGNESFISIYLLKQPDKLVNAGFVVESQMTFNLTIGRFYASETINVTWIYVCDVL